MAISMMLELEEGTTLESVSKVLSAMNASHGLVEGRLEGNFQRSNCFFSFMHIVPPRPIVAEKFYEDWLGSVGGLFVVRANDLERGEDDIQEFLSLFYREFSFRFVLSFQYEGIYCVRGKKGILVLRSMVRRGG